MYVDNPSIEEKYYSSSSELRSFSTKPPSSKCAKVIMSPVCSWSDVAYRIYNNSGLVSSVSEYGCDVYADAQENVSSNTTSCEEYDFRVLGT